MLRLRTTVSLSLLALITGIAGTAWLSTFTDKWRGPPAAAVTHVEKVRTVLRRHARTAHAVPSPSPAPLQAAIPRVEAATSLPTLTPIDMPPLKVPLFERAALGSGRVVLRLAVNGDGRVEDTSIAQTSGDAALDDRAVRTVLRWRFAVPADHPDGLTGELVMRFDGTPADH